MKRIIIFYATYGGGHLSAARSIKENIETNMLEKERKCHLVTILEDYIKKK